MSEELSPAQHAAAIDGSRQRLSDFVLSCTDEQWTAAPVDGDPRPVGVITDHVAHAYEYLAGWISDLLAGESPEVTTDLVDDLNADHAQGAGALTPADVAEHLKTSGDALIDMIRNLEPAELELGDGRVARLAVIAARHADGHRDEIEAALG
jgi:hypothetical protein